MGRDMQWIRIERYYETWTRTPPAPSTFGILPMMCQHCGNAPCEPVCPVYATYHTPDGLNAQVYNRCVGTRYCANNCPYKVRAFNWFTATGRAPEPLNWQLNPDVTVREKGVMEKCTFCVQRIREAQNRASDGGPRRCATASSCRRARSRVPPRRSCSATSRTRTRASRSCRTTSAATTCSRSSTRSPAVTYLKKVTFHQSEAGEH